MSDLVEVFSIIYKDKDGGGEAPSGSISVFDGKRGQIIYRRRRGQTQKLSSDSAAQNPKNDVHLLMTGPYRAISADGWVAIELDLHHGCCKNSTTPYVAEILVDVYNPSTVYDEAVTEVVPTCNCSKSPSAEVKYALLSDAVEAVVEARLLHQGDDDPAHGFCFYLEKIIARSDVGDAVLFRSDVDESTRIARSSQGHTTTTTIPLARSVLALPSTSFLTIDVELGGHPSGEMVKYSKRCRPDLDTEPVLSFACEIGTLEVKITCSE